MPLVGWLCPQCKREVPLDHFESGDCRFVVHPDYAEAQMVDRLSHDLNSTTPSVTMALGCPRSYGIQRSEDYYCDPLSLNASGTGTAWHAWMDETAPYDSLNGDGAEIALSGTIDGVKLTGKTDRLDMALKLIEDWKHKSDFGIKYIKRDGVKLDHRVQLSLYAELCDQTFGWRPEQMCIWYHSSMNGRDAMIPLRSEVMTLEMALAVRPHNGNYTVRELLHQAAEPMSKWTDLPLSGKEMSFGDKSMCDYCAVRSICWTADTGAPF